MSRLDNTISDISYILNTLRAYRDIVQRGNCNTCKKKKECEYAPKPAELVRYNCPLFEWREE